MRNELRSDCPLFLIRFTVHTIRHLVSTDSFIVSISQTLYTAVVILLFCLCLLFRCDTTTLVSDWTNLIFLFVYICLKWNTIEWYRSMLLRCIYTIIFIWMCVIPTNRSIHAIQCVWKRWFLLYLCLFVCMSKKKTNSK